MCRCASLHAGDSRWAGRGDTQRLKLGRGQAEKGLAGREEKNCAVGISRFDREAHKIGISEGLAPLGGEELC
jgi:hypothetical protein